MDQSDVAKLTAPGLYRFARGLFLQVRGEGAKSWIFRYTLKGTPRYMGLGSAGAVTLAKAKARVVELRVTMLAQKLDPVAEADKRDAAERVAKDKAVPFRVRASQYIAAHEEGWRNAKHLAQWKASLATYAYPVIGDVPVHEVTVAHVVDILRPIWTTKAETARRVRGRIEAVLDYAADPDDADYRNPAAMTPRLAKALPKAGKRQAAHHGSLPYDQIAAFLAALRAREGMAARALEFAILTAARTDEVIGARWQEIDRTSATWLVPAARMKAERDHRVPLSGAALAVLERGEGQGELVFGSLSNMAMLAVQRRMGRADITTHGFRATFRTWAAECTDFAPDVCEAALAHAVKDKLLAAYQRGDLFEKRRQLMDAWARYCGATG